jgi:GT2 family glycosyltransferase
VTLQRVDLLYLACNRLAFTRETFAALLANTGWKHVHELFVYDDGSSDGTREWLEEAIERVPTTHRMVRTRFGSPVAAMAHFIESASAAMLAKTDNDAMLPAGWLEASLGVYDAHPELHFLGIEAMYPHEEGSGAQRGYAPAQFISGLGLYRRAAFAHSRPQAFQKWFGFEDWQAGQGPGLVRGWIRPALPVFLLDRIPFEPWAVYTSRYVQRGWQRSWPKYDPHSTLWKWRWPQTGSNGEEEFGGELTAPDQTAPMVAPSTDSSISKPLFDVVILSALVNNLVPCVRSLLEHEPGLRPGQIIIVDDGARLGGEALLPAVRWVGGVKPFIFARNANLGICSSDSDVILLNDDAQLVTFCGLSKLAAEARRHQDLAFCSAAVRGFVGNPEQLERRSDSLRWASRELAFVCVYIPARVYRQLGALDEQFTGYGFEDNDYCLRARRQGLRLGVFDGCVVEHGTSARSTFRMKNNFGTLYRYNERLFLTKWGRIRGGRSTVSRV